MSSKVYPKDNKKKNNWVVQDHKNAKFSQMEQESIDVFKTDKHIPEKEENLSSDFLQSQAKKSSTKEVKEVCCSALVILLLAALPVVVVVFMGMKLNDQPQEPQTNIVERDFLQNEVYHLNYTIVTELNTSTVRINYTAFFVVLGTNDNGTNFTASLQKRSEETEEDGETTIQIYDDSKMYEEILKYGVDHIDQNETEEEEEEVEEGLMGEEAEFQNVTASLPVFRFALLKNGKIANFTFPADFEAESLGLLRSLVKMFSPLLSNDLYENKETVKKVKSNEEGSYEEEESYDYETTSDSTTLKQKGTVSSAGETHNTSEKLNQQSTFTEDGELKESSMNAETEFQSEYEEPNENYTTYNFNVSFSSEQKAHLEVIEKFQSKEEYVEEFESLLQEYVEDNSTYTMTVEELVNFILGKDEPDSEVEPARLLLEEDGSLSLIKFDKDIKLVSTNVLGFKVLAYGYTKLNLNLHQDPENQLKKNPIFKVEIGAVLKLGSKKFKIPLVDEDRNLPPLTLKYTLNQIEGVVELFKGGFIQDIKELAKMIINGDFENDLVPIMLNTASLITDVSNAVKKEKDQRNPNSTLSSIFSLIKGIEGIIETKGLDLLNPKNALSQTISNSLLGFVDENFGEALRIFQTVKGNLTSIKETAELFLSQSQDEYTAEDIVEVGSTILNLVSPDLAAEYEEELKRAEDILKLIEYVRDKSSVYMTMVEGIEGNHDKNFLSFSQELIRLFFQNQTQILTFYEKSIDDRLARVSKEFASLRNGLPSITGLDKKLLDYLNTAIRGSLKTNYYYSTLSSLLSTLESLANGVVSEAVQCCQWKRKKWSVWCFCRKKYCATHNPVYGNQRAEADIFKSLKSTIAEMPDKIMRGCETFMRNASSIISNPSMSIIEKFETIKGNFLLLQPYNFQPYINAVADRIKEVEDLYSKACSNKNNLNSYLSNLKSLKSLFDGFNNEFGAFKSTAQTIFNRFSSEAYLNITTYSSIIPSIDEFFESYKSYESETKGIMNGLSNLVKSFNPRDFITSTKTINSISDFYNKIGQSLNKLCYMQESQKSQIESFRGIYKKHLKEVQKLVPSYLDSEVGALKSFLNNMGNNLYQSYMAIPFCQTGEFFKSNITTLVPELENFEMISDLYTKFRAIWETAEGEIKSVKSQTAVLKDEFYTIFSKEGYKAYFQKVANLTKTIKSMIYNVSVGVSNLKEEAKSIQLFGFAPAQELNKALQIFSSSPFALSSGDMFVDFGRLRSIAEQLMESMNYDLLTVVVSAKEVISHFNQTIPALKENITHIKGNFSELCQSFVGLTSQVSKEKIIEIYEKFRNIYSFVKEGLLPNLKATGELLKAKYQQHVFTQKSLEKHLNKTIASLEAFTAKTEEKKSSIFSKIRELADKAQKLIDKLEIGNLNKIYKLGKTIYQEFDKSVKKFPALAKEILNFEYLVGKNFNKIFEFDETFAQIKQKIKDEFGNSLAKIKDEINKTQEALKDSELFAKLKEQPIYEKIENFTENFRINFDGLFSQTDGKVSEIKNFIQSLAEGVGEIVRDLSEIHNTAKDAEKNIKMRIENIKKEFKRIKNKFTNLISMIFTVINADLGETVRKSVHYILKQVDDIVYLDIGSLNTTASENLPAQLNFIPKAISFIMEKYDKIVEFREKYVTKMDTFLEKVDNFLESKITVKMQKLKEAQLFIKSQSNLEEPAESYIIHQKEFLDYKAPIAAYQQLIITSIGTFKVKIDIDFLLSLAAKISLSQFRNVEIGANFSVAVGLDFTFSYAICYVLEIGIYVDGNIIRADVEPAFQLKNVIPVQLVKAIANVPQLNQDKTISVHFITDLSIYAAELEIGLYIKHIWLEIIWKKVKFCFKILWKKWCISFKIPAGFRLKYKRHDLGTNIVGYAWKKRLFDLKILEFEL